MPPNQRIILDCERMKHPHTGLYHFCKELGTALLNQKFENANLCFYLPEAERNVFGADVDYILHYKLHRFLRKTFSDRTIWHSTYQLSNYPPRKKRGLNIVKTIHDLNFLHEGKSHHKQKKCLQKIQNAIDNADVLVTISQFVKQEVLNHLNTKGKEVHVIYNGRNKPRSDDFEKPVGNFETPFFFTIGTIVQKKNFHVLPALLLKNDHALVISGITQDQDYKQKIIAEASRLGVAHRVIFTGSVTDAQKNWLMKNCTAFAFPSIAEGFGLPVIEAMQLGTPVLLSKATSLPEIGGPHALYFNDLSTEGINNLAMDFLNSNYKEPDRKNLVDWAAQFDWDKAAAQYRNIYSSLII